MLPRFGCTATIRQPYWLPNFLTDLVLVLLTGLVQRHWHNSWTHLIHPAVCQVFRGKHDTQVNQASYPEGPVLTILLVTFSQAG